MDLVQQFSLIWRMYPAHWVIVALIYSCLLAAGHNTDEPTERRLP